MRTGYEIRQILEKAHQTFMNSGVREGSPDYPVIKEPEHNEDNENIVYASELFSCVRKNAIGRLPESEQHQYIKFPEIWFPQETGFAGLGMMTKAQAGRYMQLALAYASGGSGKDGFYCSNEERIAHPTIAVRGRMDSVLYFNDGEIHIIEFKAMGGYSNTHFNLKKGHVAQALTYLLSVIALNAGEKHTTVNLDKLAAHVVTIDVTQKADEEILQVWSLLPSGDGYYVRQHDGAAWSSINNRAEVINQNWIATEVIRQLIYREHLAKGVAELPFADPLSQEAKDEGAWACMRGADKYPPKSGNATFVPTPWCGAGCYFPEGQSSIVVPVIGGEVSLRKADADPF